MNLKRHLERFVRGWLPKEPNLPRHKLKTAEVKARISKPKPRWWRPFWIILVIATIALGVANTLFLNVSLQKATIGLIGTVLCIGFAYYIRVRPSIRVNRALYILLGITPTGLILLLLWTVSIGRLVTDTIGALPSLLIGSALCFGIGAFMGDWIGKKRNYLLPMSP
jgi:hypothetical protein